MYNWYVSFVKSGGGVKTKKVKAPDKQTALKKALKNENYYTINSCVLVK